MAETKNNSLITINTEILLSLTGWNIDQLLDVLNVPESQRENLKQAITKDDGVQS